MPNQPISGNDLARFAGLQTFMRLPEAQSPEGLDVVVMGIPMDIGTSWRSGTRFGPKQIRQESAMIRPYNLQTGAAPFDSLQVADMGDVAINTFSLAESLNIIESAYDGLHDYPVVPATLGGDHSLTLPILRSIAKKHGPVALVHIDAHADVNDEMFGERETHGTVFRRAYEERLLEPDLVYQIGLRGTGYTAEDFSEATGWGFNMITAPEIWHKSLTPLGQEIRHAIGDHPCYLTYDLMARIGQNAVFDLRKTQIIPADIEATEMRLHCLPRRNLPARPVRIHKRPEAPHQLQARKKCQRQNKYFNQRFVPQR